MTRTVWVLVILFLSTITFCIQNDIVYVIDISGSLSQSDLNYSAEFLHDITEYLTIGSSDIQISIVTFSSVSTILYDFNNLTTLSDVLTSLLNLKSLTTSGGTKTYLALNDSYDLLTSPSSGMRTGINKTVVVLTDGKSDNLLYTRAAAENLHQNGMEVFSVGVGTEVSYDKTELYAIASDPDSYYQHDIDNFTYLCNMIPTLAVKLDPSLTSITLPPDCVTTTTTTPSPKKKGTDAPTTAADTTTTTEATTTTIPDTTTTAEATTTTTTEATTTTTIPDTTTTTEATTTTTTEATTTTTIADTTTTTEATTTTIADTTTTTEATTMTTESTTSIAATSTDSSTSTSSATTAPTTDVSIDTTTSGNGTNGASQSQQSTTDDSLSTIPLIVVGTTASLLLLSSIPEAYFLRKAALRRKIRQEMKDEEVRHAIQPYENSLPKQLGPGKPAWQT